MAQYKVRWEVTEMHVAFIDVPDGEDADDFLDSDTLAEHESGESYHSTPDRTLLEYDEVD